MIQEIPKSKSQIPKLEWSNWDLEFVYWNLCPEFNIY